MCISNTDPNKINIVLSHVTLGCILYTIPDNHRAKKHLSNGS